MKKLFYLFTFSFLAANLSAQCVADFMSVVTPNSLSVQFYDSSSVSPSFNVSYYWDFGDFNSSTQQNPTHTYSQAGTYTVYLSIFDNQSNCYDSIGYNITVTSNQNPLPCNAGFTYNIQPNSWNGNAMVWFTNTSTGFDNSSTFQFYSGVGSGAITFPATNGNLNFQYTYSPGTYVATLNILDSAQNFMCSYTDTIVIDSRCNASFTVAKDTSTAFGVVLYNTSSNEPSHSYSWSFGDGGTASGRNPSHTYTSFGDYQVCLTITDSLFNCTSTYCDTLGMDSLGNLKSGGFSLIVREPLVTSIEEVQMEEEIAIYPNPAVNQLIIEVANQFEAMNVQVFDMGGKLVHEVNMNTATNKHLLDVSEFDHGLYFVRINTSNASLVKKFIKQ